MFTGLIEEIGRIKKINNDLLYVNCSKILTDAAVGDSIAVNGACLTINDIFINYISFYVSRTTRMHTRFHAGDIRIGEEVNLERAVTPTTRLGGHIVSGHVDCKLKIISIKKAAEDTYFEFLYPKKLRSLIAVKGSVAIDGISLTISDVYSSSFSVTVIPHTLSLTNLKSKRIGDYMHLEADLFARYINNILKTGDINEQNKRIIKAF